MNKMRAFMILIKLIDSLWRSNAVFTTFQAAMGTMDSIIDTVPAVRPLEPLIQLLMTNGKVVTLGITIQPLDLPVFPLIIGT